MDRFDETLDDWQESSTCSDDVIGVLDAILRNSTNTPRAYALSPIFLLTDALPNENQEATTWTQFLTNLANFENPIFTFFYPPPSSSGATCAEPNDQSASYRQLRQLARFTRGTTTRLTLDVISAGILEATLNFYTKSLLIARDFLGACQWTHANTGFYVDSSVGRNGGSYRQIFVELYSSAPIALQLYTAQPARPILAKQPLLLRGDATVYTFDLPKEQSIGSFRLIAKDQQDGLAPCHVRVYASSALNWRDSRNAFFGTTTTKNHDRERAFVPVNTSIQPVGRITGLKLDANEELNAAIAIRSFVEAKTPAVQTLYKSSNAILRSDSIFDLYFADEFTCTTPNEPLDVEVTVTLPNGEIVQRVTSTQCSNNIV